MKDKINNLLKTSIEINLTRFLIWVVFFVAIGPTNPKFVLGLTFGYLGIKFLDKVDKGMDK